MKQERIQTWVSVGEIISSLAIVISLIFLAYEYNRSELMTVREAENILYERVLEIERMVIENEKLAGILIKVQAETEPLSEVEELQFFAYSHIFYDAWETLWEYHSDGILDMGTWSGWNDWFKEESLRRKAKGWEGARRHFSGEFRDYADAHFESS